MTSSLFAHLESHLVLSLCALVAAIAIGVPAAVLAGRRPVGRALALGGAGALRVVPSVAVLTLTLPYLGLGFRPALLALVVLALPPIIVNTDLGLRSVPAPLREAALGMGMTAGQVRGRVEWPLALPLVLAGVRTAAVEVVASATLASFIGGGGLGDLIVDGLATDDTAELLLGAATVAALALVVDTLLATAARATRPRGLA
jgi:osmoprotectant transport system permease protein